MAKYIRIIETAKQHYKTTTAKLKQQNKIPVV